MKAIVLTALGAAMIIVALHDIFHTLFHPAGRGALSDWIARGIWGLFRSIAKRWPSTITLAGPCIFIAIIGSWGLLVVFGFALIYDPRMATQYVFAPGMDPKQHHTFVDAFNVSLGSLITLGGDINAKSKALRLIMGMEAVIGFGLLTASVSWLLSIYPVLELRRAVAHKATLFHHAEDEVGTRVLQLGEQELFDALSELTLEMTQLRAGLAQFPVSYYFHMGEGATALPGILEYLRVIADRAAQPSFAPGVRLAATALGGAIYDYAALVADVYLQMPKDNTRAVIRAYARDHLREFVSYEP